MINRVWDNSRSLLRLIHNVTIDSKSYTIRFYAIAILSHVISLRGTFWKIKKFILSKKYNFVNIHSIRET